ncbi:MAG: hypothetical protein PHR35_03450 [Kiritimatiellae bacterium]|nr:hypothetical protein [Kiritimatiellia bacterium]
MKSVLWPVRYGFKYPAGRTVGRLEARLRTLAPEWPGWQGFPWRVTRNLQRHLGRHPLNFHYLMMQRCVMGYAAHLLLTEKFFDRLAVFSMLIREQCEVAGLLRGLLVEAFRFEMRATGRPYILDATGPEDGHCHVAARELERRRKGFRKNIEEAAREFVAILNLASQTDDLDDRILGHSLRYWLRGADMPLERSLEVLMEETAEGIALTPCRREMQAFIKARKPVPRIVLPRCEWEGEEEAEDERLKAEAGEGISHRGHGDTEGGETVGRSDGEAVGVGTETPDKNVPRSTPNAQPSTAAEAPQSEEGGQDGIGSMRDRQAKAGRHNAIVKDRSDRRVVRGEVRRIMGAGLSQTEACRQVAEQMRKGYAGAHKLTMKYDISAFEATASVVRRVYVAKW